MSKTVDERVVEMRFDNKQFESGVQTSLSTLDKLKQSLNLEGATKGLENVRDTASKIDMTPLGAAVETVSGKFTALEVMAVTALANITNSAVDAGKKIVAALTIDPIKTGFEEYELKMGSVQTIMASTGADLETVNKYLEELNAYSDKTIYSFSDMTNNIGKFTNAGVSLEDAVKAMQGISNEAALSGANANQASNAMYNFSQALSSGYVKLIDWKSIENAGMATVEFKNQLLQTALEMGTVEKTADGMYEVLTRNGNGKLMKETISATSNFNDSLQYQWMTSDVLIKTLGAYADETTDIGKKAFEAATEVKTFSQLFDTLKESAQSGWARSWEIVVGDFDEAKELFSELYDVFGGIIDESADARNNLLEGALGAQSIDAGTWEKFASDIGSSADTFQQALTNTAKAHNIDIDSMIEKEGSFAATLKNGWLTDDLINETFSNLDNDMDQLSDAQLKSAGYTEEQIKQLRDLAKTAEETGTPLHELMENMSKPSGRELLIDSFRNILSSLGNIMKGVRDAFKEVFPPMTSEQLYNLIEGFHSLTEKLKVGKEGGEKIKRTFKGLFSVAGIVTDALSAIFEVAIKPLVGGLSSLGGGILDVTANIGDWLVNLRDTISESEAVTKATEFVVDIFEKLGEYVEVVYEAAKELIKEGLTKLSTELGKLEEPAKKLMEQLKSLAKDGIDKLGEKLGGFKEAVDKVVEVVKTLIRDGIDAAREKLSLFGKDTDEATDKVKTFATDGIKAGCEKFLEFGDGLETVTGKVKNFVSDGMDVASEKLSAFSENVGKVKDGLPGFGDKIKEAFGSVASQIADAFSDVTVQDAIGAGLLAALVIAIKKFVEKFKEVKSSLQDIVDGVVGVLDSARGALEAWQTSIKADTLLTIAGAVALLTASLIALTFVDGDKLGAGLAGVSTLLVEVVGTLKLLSSDKFDTTGLTKSATAIVVVAAAISILADALVSLNEFQSWKDTWPALTALVGAMVGLVASVKQLSKLDIDGNEFIKTSAGLVVFAFAIKKLAESMVVMGQLKTGEIVKGLGTMAVLLAEIGVFMKKSDIGSLQGGSKTISAIAVSMLILYAAVSLFGKMEIPTLIQGFIAVAALLAAMAVAVKIMGSINMAGVASSILAMAVALTVLAIPIKQLGGMDLGSLIQGLLGVAAALVGMSVVLAMLATVQKMGGNFERIGASLLLMATALAIVAIPIKTLGSMPWQNLALGLGAVVVMLVAFGATATILAPLGGVLMTVSGAFALFGVAILGIGTGILAMATAFTVLATLGTAGALAVSAALTTIVMAIAEVIPYIAACIAQGIVTFSQVLIEGAPVFFEALTTILLGIIQTIADVGPPLIETVIILLDALLASIAEHAPNMVESGWQTLLAFIQGIADHMEEMVTTGFDIIIAFLDGVEQKIPEVVEKGFELLLTFINSMTDSIKKNTPLLVEAMHDLIMALVDAGIQVLTGGIGTFEEAGEKIMDSGLIEGIWGMLGKLLSTVWDLLKKAVQTIIDNLPEWLAAAKDLISEMIKGIKDKVEDIKDAIKSLLTDAKDAVLGKISDFLQAGKDVIDGLISGIKEKAQDAIEAAKGVVNDALEGAKKLLGIASPSKEFKKVGMWSDMGLVVGFQAYADRVENAAEDVAGGALNAMGETISKISDVIGDNVDVQPTITPVVDLTNLKNSVKGIDAMFSRNQAMSISASMNRSKYEDGMGGTTSSSGNTYSFTQNNYSPKALSRVEIYRQTKNQFSAMERMVES